MIKNAFLYPLILPFILVLSCTKIEKGCNDVVLQQYDNDTVLPSIYFMHYPGSWWTYTDGDSIIISDWKNVKTHVSTPSGQCRTIIENNHILPEKTYQNYQVVTYADKRNSEYIPYISETQGILYSKVTNINGGTETHTIRSFPKMDSMVVNQVVYFDVIRVRHLTEYYYEHVGSGGNGGMEYYYSKNVGQIRRIHILNGASVHVNDLVSYWIAPH